MDTKTNLQLIKTLYGLASSRKGLFVSEKQRKFILRYVDENVLALDPGLSSARYMVVFTFDQDGIIKIEKDNYQNQKRSCVYWTREGGYVIAAKKPLSEKQKAKEIEKLSFLLAVNNKTISSLEKEIIQLEIAQDKLKEAGITLQSLYDDLNEKVSQKQEMIDRLTFDNTVISSQINN